MSYGRGTRRTSVQASSVTALQKTASNVGSVNPLSSDSTPRKEDDVSARKEVTPGKGKLG